MTPFASFLLSVRLVKWNSIENKYLFYFISDWLFNLLFFVQYECLVLLHYLNKQKEPNKYWLIGHLFLVMIIFSKQEEEEEEHSFNVDVN